jgi:hypothetical protein
MRSRRLDTLRRGLNHAAQTRPRCDADARIGVQSAATRTNHELTVASAITRQPEVQRAGA